MNFLNQAIALAEEILLVSSALQLSGQPANAEKETDAYVALLEKREPMIEKLNQLIKQVTNPDKALRQKLDEVLKKILDSDKEQQRIIKHLQTAVSSSLKDTRSGQRLSEAYSNPYSGLGRGLLDTSQ